MEDEIRARAEKALYLATEAYIASARDVQRSGDALESANRAVASALLARETAEHNYNVSHVGHSLQRVEFRIMEDAYLGAHGFLPLPDGIWQRGVLTFCREEALDLAGQD